MGDPDGGTSERIQTAQLLALAGEVDASVTERTLEFWRHQGLLPRPRRSGQNGKTPVWTYAPEAASQLHALLRLRAQTRDPDVLRVALWYEGYLIETARVRSSISAYLRQLRDNFETELAKRLSTTDDPEARWQALRAMADLTARKRGKGFPRLSRQALSDRTTAIAVTLGMVLGDERAMEHLEAAAPAVERLVGVDRGRRFRPAGADPWLHGPAGEGLAGFAEMGSLPRLVAMVDAAPDQELELARDLGRALLGGLSAFSRIADSMVGRDNASGLGGIRILDGDTHAALVIVPLVLSILNSGELAQNLVQVLTGIESNVRPLERLARELAALSKEERAERLKKLTELPFADHMRLNRLLFEFSGDVE